MPLGPKAVSGAPDAVSFWRSGKPSSSKPEPKLKMARSPAASTPLLSGKTATRLRFAVFDDVTAAPPEPKAVSGSPAAVKRSTRGSKSSWPLKAAASRPAA
jgi:hypothetical protein